MTVLVGTLVCALALLGAALAGQLASVASLRARAQTAADAAALAAMAESAPGGGGRPEVAASFYASRNDARLLDCRCPVGGRDAYVRVSLEGLFAEARAVFEPHLLAPARAAPDAEGLHPALRRAVDRLVSAAQGAVWVTSGYRSTEEQARLWASALARYGSPEAANDWVAPPGHSLHERGLAVDLGGDLGRALRLIEDLGLALHRPLANEPWHFELMGSRS
jgi:hypothetical protein